MMKKILHLNSKFRTNASNVTNSEFFGAKHIVIEGVGSMICNTVMNNILYTKKAIEDLAVKTKTNVHAPASHPTDQDGNFILAGSPEAVHQSYVGAFAFNYRMQGDRLIHDLAINPEVAERSEAGREILHRIENNIDIDTSTGLLIYEGEDESGVGQCGTNYDMIATNIELDHDAILLEERGAATTLQGVGVFANHDKKISVDQFNVNASIANTSLPISDDEYNETEAVERIKGFTESGEKPSSNYRRFFFFFDRENAEDYSSYKYPFADIVDGKPVAVKSAILSAKKAIESDSEIDEKEKEVILSSIAEYESKMKSSGLLGNAWASIKKFIFGNSLSHSQIHEKIYEKLNEGSTEFDVYPVEIFEDHFIYQESLGKMYKQWYNIVNDDVQLTGSPEEVERETVYKSKESDVMKDKILNALKAAGINTEGMDEDTMLNEFAKLGSKPEEKEADEANADESEGAEDAEANADEPLTKETVASMIKEAVSEALKTNSQEQEASEEVKLAEQVEALNMGINKEAAIAMGINAMKSVLSSNGIVAFNAKSEYNNTNTETLSDEMPD